MHTCIYIYIYIFFFFLPGGTYLLDINIPDTYPFNPPKVSFTL